MFDPTDILIYISKLNHDKELSVSVEVQESNRLYIVRLEADDYKYKCVLQYNDLPVTQIAEALEIIVDDFWTAHDKHVKENN